jgi:glycosyltransferase involved in cell wall biosynthesis
MKVALVSCVFPPEPLTSASTSHSLALELAKRGHRVSVITSYPSRPEGKLYPGFRRRLMNRFEGENGIEIIRCFSTTSRASTLLSRLAENLSFGLCSGLALARIERPDAVYINSWPIFAGGIACLIARARRIPFVLSIQDVYPESLIALKSLNPKNALARWLRWIDASMARMAFSVVVISASAEETYLRDRGVSRERVQRIPNWRTTEDQPTQDTARAQRKVWGIEPGAFLVVFAGNVTAACGIEGVIEAVAKVGEGLGIRMMVAGSGSALESCRGVTERLKSRSVDFGGTFQASETLTILGAGDILILPTQGDQSLVSMPSKLISYMMSGRPVLAIARRESDIARAVMEAGCGWVVEPGDPAALQRQLEMAAGIERSELTRMGALGREYVLAHFSTEACLPKLAALMEKAGLS